MKIFCIDDDKEFLLSLKDKIISYSMKKNVDIDVNTLDTIPSYVPQDIDAYILDILIGEDKIFDFVQKVRSTNLLVPIIIVSSNEHFVFDSLKLNVFHFIRKRKINEELEESLDRLINYSDSILPYVNVKQANHYYRIKLKDICFIEVKSRETNIYTINNEYWLNKDVKKVFDDKLNLFIQVSKSCYVNPAYINGITKDTIIVNNKKLPLGRKYVKVVRDYLNKISF